MYAKNYIQVVGYINQVEVGLNALDEGGGESLFSFLFLLIIPPTELDPHGDDEQGNPLGGLVYSNGLGQNAAGFAQQFKSGGSGGAETQIVEWIE